MKTMQKVFVRYGALVGKDMTITLENFEKECEQKGLDTCNSVEGFICDSIRRGYPKIVKVWFEKDKDCHEELHREITEFTHGIFAYPADSVYKEMINLKYHRLSDYLLEELRDLYREGRTDGFRYEHVRNEFIKKRQATLLKYRDVRREEVRRKKGDKKIFEYSGRQIVHKLKDFVDNPELDWIGWDLDEPAASASWYVSSTEEYFDLLEEAINRCCNNPDNALHPAEFEVFFPCEIGETGCFNVVDEKEVKVYEKW